MHRAAIVWLRRDFRLADNPALRFACEHADSVVLAYIHAPEEEAPWQPGAASQWWLHHSLTGFCKQLDKFKQTLVIRSSSSLSSLQDLIRDSGATLVVWNRLYEPKCIERDAAIKKTLRESGIEAHSFNGSLLFEPWEIKTQQATPFKVFTPFWRACSSQLHTLLPPQAAPKAIASLSAPLKSSSIDSLKLLPAINWDAAFYKTWAPGEIGAQRQLKRFLSSACEDYKTSRDLPAVAGTSKLSPHLHFGEITPRQIYASLQADATEARSLEGKESYLREVGWRDFAHHLLYHFPHTTDAPFNPRFADMQWDTNTAALRAWQRGETGIPLVDAGMRELWTTGYMHNRVRMIAASFLTKNLRIHWLEGARWFWDTLVDADLANNSMGWQWVAGCGADAAPYYRIFNPVLQSERFDGDGEYLRRWLPELKRLNNKFIHQPWTASDAVLKAAEIQLDKHYPRPIVDLARTRDLALQSYQALRSPGQ
jgi:deoxyribodipyrimidine photo-lyase